MTNYILYSLFVCLLLARCSQPVDDPQIESNDSLNKINISTDTSLIQTISDTSDSVDNYNLLDVHDWKTEDFIIHKKDQSNQPLKNLIEYERDEWSNVSNPFVAVYRGNDFGDYFHLNFEDENGIIYDFGFGENTFGEMELFDETTFEDNKKYLNKKFTIYWNWIISTFPCCDGEYDQVDAYWPSITKLELLH